MFTPGKSIAAAALAVLSLLAVAARADWVAGTPVPITVPNYSFESGNETTIDDSWYTDAMINGGSDSNNRLTDWVIECATYRFAGRLNPGDSFYSGTTDSTNPPPNLPSPADGTQCAFMHWGSGTSPGASQITSFQDLTTIEADCDYVATVAIGTPYISSLPQPVSIANADIEIIRSDTGNYVVYSPQGPGPDTTGHSDGVWEERSVTLTKEKIAQDNLVGVGLKIRLWAKNQYYMTQTYQEKKQVNFDNVRLEKIPYVQGPDLTIKKFFDCNLDNTKNGEDIDLSGWQFNVSNTGHGGSYDQNFTTDVNGEINITGLDAGDYDITETVKGTGWVLAGANPRTVSVSGATEVNFGNQLPGDANQDEKVNLADFTLLKAHFGEDPAGWTYGNFNTDTTVNLADFTILKANFGLGAPSAGGVPEPATMALLALGAAALLRRRPRA